MGLHAIECQLFAAKPVATLVPLQLIVEYRLNSNRYAFGYLVETVTLGTGSLYYFSLL